MYHNLSQLLRYSNPSNRTNHSQDCKAKRVHKRLKAHLDIMCQCSYVKHVFIKLIYKCYVHMINHAYHLPKQNDIYTFMLLLNNTNDIFPYMSKDEEIQSCKGIVDDLRRIQTLRKLNNTDFEDVINKVYM